MSKSLFSLIVSVAGVIVVGLTCTEITYDNPIDMNGKYKNKPPQAFNDDDGDGTVNWKDDDSEFFERDTTPPVIVLNGGDTVSIARGDDNGDLVKYINGVTVTDNSGAPTTLLDVESTVDIYSTNPDTFYTIKYQYQDSTGNIGRATRYVYITKAPEKDTKSPVITIGENPYYIQVNTVFTDPGVSVFDNHDGTIASSKVTVTGTVDTKTVGKYILTYTVKDSANNTGTNTREVIVQKEGPGVDRINPVITLKGQDTIRIAKTFKTMKEYIPTYKEAGYTATDNHDGDITAKVKPGNFTQFGDTVWYIPYEVTDSAGNNAPTAKRIFITPFTGIVTKPIIDLVYPDSIIQLILPTTGKAKWAEPGYTASDLTDQNLTEKVIVDSSKLIPNLDSIGTYYVTYTVTNSNNLTATKTRTVQVVDNPYDIKAPVITLLGRNPDTVLAGSTAYKDPGATALDNKDGDVTAKITVTGITTINLKKFGKDTITYNCVDKAGNKSSVPRYIYIVPDTLTTDLFVRYLVPLEDSLPTIGTNMVFTTFNVDGDGPILDSTTSPGLTKVTFTWINDANNKQFQLQFNYKQTPYNKDFNTITKNFNTDPSMTLAGTLITGLDGKYYVTYDTAKKRLIWVRTDKKFAVILTR